jgi:hypothetical protein
VLEPDGLFGDVQSPGIRGLGIIKLSVVFAEHADLIENTRSLEGIRAKGRFRKRKGLLKNRSRLAVAARFAQLNAFFRERDCSVPSRAAVSPA